MTEDFGRLMSTAYVPGETMGERKLPPHTHTHTHIHAHTHIHTHTHTHTEKHTNTHTCQYPHFVIKSSFTHFNFDASYLDL